MNSSKNRLSKLERETPGGDELIFKIEYVRDWRGDMQDVAETRYIRPGHGWIDIDDIRYRADA